MKKSVRLSLAFVFLFVITLNLQAQTANDCVEVTSGIRYGDDVFYLKNTCNYKITVAFCIEGENAPDDELCGNSSWRNYYQTVWRFNPGEKASNISALPRKPRTRVMYAACRGYDKDIIEHDKAGRFSCVYN